MRINFIIQAGLLCVCVLRMCDLKSMCVYIPDLMLFVVYSKASLLQHSMGPEDNVKLGVVRVWSDFYNTVI